MKTETMEGILFDLDGVLVTGGKPLPGAIETLGALQRANIPFQILSNMTLQPRAAIRKRFSEHGVELNPAQILTPPAAAAQWLREQGNPPVAAFVAPPTMVELEGLDLLPPDAERDAAFVLLGDLGDGWNAAVLNRALRLLLNGGQLVTCGMGRYWMAPEGLRLDVGAYAQALAFASGQTPIVIGKPSANYFQLAVEALGIAPARVIMVGDDIFNDIQAGQDAGLNGLLVQTGKFRPQDLERGVTPEWTAPDVRHVLPLVGLELPA